MVSLSNHATFARFAFDVVSRARAGRSSTANVVMGRLME